MRVYLSGSIEYSPDQGRGWRAELAPFLRSLGHEGYDPSLDEKKNLNEDEVRRFRGWKTTDLARFQATVRKIIQYDLDRVENDTDLVVCYWDEYAAKGAGTHAEVTAAHRKGVPVYLVTAIPVTQVSGWILGCASEVFSDFDGLRSFLREKHGMADGAPALAGRMNG